MSHIASAQLPRVSSSLTDDSCDIGRRLKSRRSMCVLTRALKMRPSLLSGWVRIAPIGGERYPAYLVISAAHGRSALLFAAFVRPLDEANLR